MEHDQNCCYKGEVKGKVAEFRRGEAQPTMSGRPQLKCFTSPSAKQSNGSKTWRPGLLPEITPEVLTPPLPPNASSFPVQTDHFCPSPENARTHIYMSSSSFTYVMPVPATDATACIRLPEPFQPQGFKPRRCTEHLQAT